MTFFACIKHLNKLSLQVGLTVFTSLASLGLAKPSMALFGLPPEIYIGGFSSVTDYRWITVSNSPSYINDYIVPAANQWNSQSSKVRLTRVTSGNYNLEVQIRFNGDDPMQAGIMVPNCIFGERKICLILPWRSALVIGYEDVMSRKGYTTSERISNFIHEIGHSLSLDHVSTQNPSLAVMKQGTQSIGPQQYDVNNLRAKWGN